MNNQKAAFEKLSRLKVGALFMSMGTGKTKVALDLMASKQNKVDYMLYICPCSVKNEIEKEREKWQPNLQFDLVGCESIGSSDRIYLEVLKKAQNSRCFIVVDESLKIKNKEAKRTERILKLGECAEYKLILNGTPVTKNVLDLWAQMQFLSPKILSMSYNHFKNTYCEYYIRGNLKGLVKKQYNIEHLISLIQPYIFDCELEINAKKQYYDYSYSMTSQENAEYEIIKSSFLNSCFDEMKSLDFFALSTLLQSHYCKAAEKSRILNQLINDIDGKVIVFVKFLESIPDGALKVIGEMNEKQRAETIKQFKDSENKKALYITYGCGAFGLNLQFCKNIIFAEHTFDYAMREQAEHRIYRTGQEYDCNYYNLWCNVGLEKLIQASLDKKASLLNEVKKEIDKGNLENLINKI